MLYYHGKKLSNVSFDKTVERVIEGLSKEGFGVLSEIDVKETLKKKLDVDFKKYRILGACNPFFAHKALQAEDKIGVMLPCNVIVEEQEPGIVEVAAVDPLASMQAVENPNLEQKLGLKAKQFLIFDKGLEEIDTHIKQHQHDFIVMGSHGTKGFRELIGSNTQKIVRHSHVPVLVVKKKPKQFEIKNIVFAANFEEDVHRPLSKIIEFADLMKAKIHLLYVNMPISFKETDEAETNMQAFLKKCPRGTCSINIYNALNEERGIQRFAKKIKADLIAMTTHGKTGFFKMISPSITESLVNHSDIPVLSINIYSV